MQKTPHLWAKLVEVDSPTSALHVWSVVRELTATRATLVNWLERCWPTEYQSLLEPNVDPRDFGMGQGC